MRSIRHPRRLDDGVATVWVLMVCGVVLAATGGALVVAQVMVLRHHVDAAADSAALAAAQGTAFGNACRLAAKVADVHRVSLDRCDVEADGVTVQVTTSVPAPGVVGRIVARVSGHARAGPR